MEHKRNSENGEAGAKAIDSILVKYFIRSVVALTVILIFLTLVQCSIKKPESPIGAGGIVSDTISTDFQEVYLDSIDIKVLDNDTLYFGMAFNLSGTSGQMVKLTAIDYLSISGRFEINYNFNGEF